MWKSPSTLRYYVISARQKRQPTTIGQWEKQTLLLQNETENMRRSSTQKVPAHSGNGIGIWYHKHCRIGALYDIPF